MRVFKERRNISQWFSPHQIKKACVIALRRSFLVGPIQMMTFYADCESHQYSAIAWKAGGKEAARIVVQNSQIRQASRNVPAKLECRTEKNIDSFCVSWILILSQIWLAGNFCWCRWNDDADDWHRQNRVGVEFCQSGGNMCFSLSWDILIISDLNQGPNSRFVGFARCCQRQIAHFATVADHLIEETSFAWTGKYRSEATKSFPLY